MTNTYEAVVSMYHFLLFQYDMAQIAALLHRAADLKNEREEPTTKRIKYLLPKPALSLREPRPQQWANMVQQAWRSVQHQEIPSCKAQVLGKNSFFHWFPLNVISRYDQDLTNRLFQIYYPNGLCLVRVSSPLSECQRAAKKRVATTYWL